MILFKISLNGCFGFIKMYFTCTLIYLMFTLISIQPYTNHVHSFFFVCFFKPGDTRSISREAVLTEFVSRPRRSPYVIKILEWFETPKGFLLILERPHHKCITLYKFYKRQKGGISEDLARIIMWKVVRAVTHCVKHGVVHHDVKGYNILLNPETLELKLIDFGYASLVLDRDYKPFGGNVTSGMNRIDGNSVVDHFL